MAENGPPDKKRPRRSSSLPKTNNKTAGRQCKESSAPDSSSILSLFNNAPPIRIGCPLCGQMVLRYRINQHIDQGCKGNQNEDDVNRIISASDVTPEPSAKAGPPASPYFAAKHSTPEKNSNLPGGNNFETKGGSGEQRSPYFKKVGKLVAIEDPPKVGPVKNLSLGSLSTRLSRKWRGHSKDESSQDDQPCPTQGGTTEQKPKEKPLKGNQGSPPSFQSCGGALAGLNKECDIQEDDSGSLSDGLDDFAEVSHSLRCRELGLPRKGHQQENNHQENPEVDQLGIGSIAEKEGLTGTYTKEEPSKLGPHSFSSKQQDSTTKEAYRNRMPQFSCSTGDATEPLSVEAEAGATTELEMDEAFMATLEKANFPNSGEIVEPVLDSSGHPYYLRNFLMVLEAVLENDDDRRLFNEEDLDVIARFYKLSGSFDW